MITYNYACTNTKCKNEWEAEQTISEEPLKKCPKCKKETAKRLISGGTGFILQGNGWAADSYSKK